GQRLMLNLTPTAVLLLQIAVILITCRVVSRLAGRLRQPPVLGQMIAGVLLGPSVLGLLLPGVQRLIFPADSLTVVNALGQLGVVLYMFLVGLELDFDFVRRNVRSGTMVALSG